MTTALERKLFTPPGAMAAETGASADRTGCGSMPRCADPASRCCCSGEEYRAGQPEGYGYSRFCDLYAAWRGRLSPTMRQSHPLGERLFVDYAGQTVEVIDAITGEVRTAQIFVAALGNSASAGPMRKHAGRRGWPDWIEVATSTPSASSVASRVRWCATISSRASLRPVATSSGINRSHYADMAAHYGTAIVPTRVRKPRDKAKVEVAVQLVQRWVLARLRHRRFFSLAELNAAIVELVDVLNTRPMRHLGCSSPVRFSRRPSAAHCCSCRRSHTSTLKFGAAAVRASTTTSRCMDTGIPCHPG